MKRGIFRPADGVLIALILICAGAVFFALSTRSSGTVAEISRNNQILYTVSLTERGERRYAIKGDIPVEIVAAEGKIWFESAECPDKLCIRSGKLYQVGDTAACLPAGVVIRVRGTDDADAITGTYGSTAP